MKFDLPKENSSIIKVLGVGGGGSNAVNHMCKQGIQGVDFIVCNTDQQALDISPVPVKIQLGSTLTEGRGAGSIPEVGKNAALEDLENIKDFLSKSTKMAFITAGMGGGTGTGAAPVIAQAAREMGILTVGIVTMPFFFEGRKRRQQAEQGIEEIRENVDTLLIINNEKLREMCGNLPIAQAFAMADDVLTTAAKGIAEIITRTGYINVDFEDVRTVMTESGVAIMGSAQAEGEDRAIKAVEKALASPLLNDNNIEGARYVLLNITFGNQEVLMDEISDITDYIQEEAGATADVIWGYGMDETLGDQLSVTIIATGFNSNPNTGVNLDKKPEKRVMKLDEKQETEKKPEPKNEDEPFIRKSEPKQEKSTSKSESQRIFEFDLRSDYSAPKSEPTRKEEPKEENPPPSPQKQAPKTDDWEPYRKDEEPKKEEPIINEKPTFKTTTPDSSDGHSQASKEEQIKRTNDRLSRLRELSMKLRSPSGMSDLENEPAFKRRQINLDDVPHSSESSASRYTLGEEEDESGEKKTRLRPNNPFLHDNVD